MTIIQAIALGIVQGLTEFLPVSSSGHLVLLQKIFGIAEPALFFDTMLHCGTLAAVLIALRKDIAAILRHIAQPLTAYLIIATVPTVIVALLFKDTIGNLFASGSFLGAAFLLTAFFLAASETLSRRAAKKSLSPRPDGEMKWTDALVVGCMQAVAIIPGVSRSGSTLAGSLARRLDRGFAARFSFLLSIPAILGALVLQLHDIAKEGSANAAASSVGMVQIIAGTLVAGIVGFFAVTFMLRLIKERTLYGFALYTALLGSLVLIDRFATHRWF